MGRSLFEIISIVKNKLESLPMKGDIRALLEICNLYDTPVTEIPKDRSSLDLSDDGENDDLAPFQIHEAGQFTCKEFIDKYKTIMHILFVCLQLDIEIFVPGKFLILHNIYRLKANLVMHRRKVYAIMTKILSNANCDNNSSIEIIPFLQNSQRELLAIDGVCDKLNIIVEKQVLDDNDTILQMILPYFQEISHYNEIYL